MIDVGGLKNKDLAALWGITPSRVSVLVKQGRAIRAAEDSKGKTEPVT
jgi:hypothetical protein